MEVGTVVHVFVRDVADHQKCAECAKKLYDYQYYIYWLSREANYPRRVGILAFFHLNS